MSVLWEVFRDWCPYGVGYAFSIFGGWLLVRPIVDQLWKEIESKKEWGIKKVFGWHSAVVGTIEAVLYTSAWVMNQKEFIGVWLVLKVAGRWQRWEHRDAR